MKLKPFFAPDRLEAGCDEAGRGCLAGAVFAAAVILPPDFSHEWLNDSKQLTERQRQTLRPIIEREAISWAVEAVEPEEIDEINILNASIVGMQRACRRLHVRPDFLLIDGNRFKPFDEMPFLCVVKGDSKFASIAAASILAKTHRDDYMDNLHRDFPEYEWNKNKGYPTAAHRAAIGRVGACEVHRKSFRLLPDAVQGVLF